jgi:hypothetical protein
MKNALALVVFGLLISSPVLAQAPEMETQPPASTTQPPASTTQTPATAPAPRAQRPVRSAAPTSLTPCQGTDKMQLRTCQMQNIKDARKALDMAITESCRKQGVRGPDLLGCRADAMMKTAQGLH